MALLVKKFGGTSVADVACMKRVANRIFEAQQEGNQVVVVVSAMGKTTDELCRLARDVHADPNDREFDMLLSTGEQISVSILAMALHSLGAKAVSMTGPQAGIMTDGIHTRAKIREIKPERVLEKLADGNIVIIAGFQGQSPNQDIATLGRGGSDLSAVAMAAALKADRCQIYTDVDGVYTTDPRIVPEASKLEEISYDEMLELASLGARVLQSRSVEFAKKYGVEIEVLSSFTGNPGTIVKQGVKQMEDIVVRGVASDINQAKVTVIGLPNKPGIASEVFKAIAAADVNVDMIIQNMAEDGKADISFTVPTELFDRVKTLADRLVQDLGAADVSYDQDVAKVSIVGIGMRSHTGIAHRMFTALAASEINIEMISTSEIKVSVLIKKGRADEAVKVLHQAFELAGVPA
jgi:aspartate kinase